MYIVKCWTKPTELMKIQNIMGHILRNGSSNKKINIYLIDNHLKSSFLVLYIIP